MNLIPKLNLNRTPAIVDSNSFVSAKNIRMDDVAGFITRDEGFKVSIDFSSTGEVIVGVISCIKELVIFTYNEEDNTSYIYRRSDDSNKAYPTGDKEKSPDFYEVKTNWNYQGGKITGSFTYNFRNELIIIVSQYDIPNGTKYPVESWNLDTDNELVDYSLAPIIPKCTCNYSILPTGNLVPGVYTFFIRYGNNNKDWTTWHQITDDILILNPEPISEILNTDKSCSIEYNNLNINSNKLVYLDMTFENSDIYRYFQIGYIFKRKDEVVGRIYCTNELSTKFDYNIKDNHYKDTIPVADFLLKPRQLYDAKICTVYQNRTYLAGYKETSYTDLSDIVKEAKIGCLKTNNLSKEWEETIKVYLYNDDGNAFIATVDNVTDPTYVKLDSITFFKTILNNISFKLVNDGDKVYNLRDLTCIDPEEKNVIIPRYGKIEDNLLRPGNYRPLFPQPPYTYSDRATINEVLSIKTAISFVLVNERGFEEEDNLIFSTELDLTDDNTILNYVDVPDVFINGEYLHIGNYQFLNGKKLRIKYCVLAKVIIHDYDYQDKEFTEENLIKIIPRDYYDSVADHYYDIGKGKKQDGTVDFEYDNPTTYGIETSNDYTIKIVGNAIFNYDVSGNNNYRTLIPYQYYKLFVHFVKDNGEVTDGFDLMECKDTEKTYILNDVAIANFKRVNGCFYFTPDSTRSYYFPFIEYMPIPDGYVGYFLSYEQVIQNSQNLANLADKEGISWYGSFETTYLPNPLIGGKIDNQQNDTSINKDMTTISMQTAKIEMVKTSIFIHNETEYKNDDKQLFKLTNILYNETPFKILEESYIKNLFKYCPGFRNKTNIIHTGSGMITPNGNLSFKTPTIDVKWYFISTLLYSGYPYNANTFLSKFETGVTIKQKTSTEDELKYYCVPPGDLSSVFNLENCYLAPPDIIYTNYKPNQYIEEFNKTIYRSRQQSDENRQNMLKYFDADNYKNIYENKGDIINITGYGLYLLIHTRYSLFVIDRSPTLTTQAQVQILDAFEQNYKEITPSNNGFGGLYEKEESIITKHGYIWYSRDEQMIFAYDSGKLNLLSKDIHTFIRHLDIDYVRFAEDYNHDRLLICIYRKEHTPITLSFSFLNNNFISLHDYSFTDNFKTYTHSYFFHKNHSSKLYEYDKDSFTYGDLTNPTDNTFDIYPKESSEDNHFGCYIDILVKNPQNIVCNLDNIQYHMDEIKDDIIGFKLEPIDAEEKLNRRYSGEELIIYSDNSNSGLLNIDSKDGYNLMNDYKKPNWNKGNWSFNYFRNILSNSTPVEGRYVSDEDSLIYGKYFIFRFIFNSATKFKFDELYINQKAY